MGLEVVAVDKNPEAIGFKVKGVYREVISTIDAPAIIEAALRHQIDGIMTLATDMPVRSVAVVAKELGLVGITEDTAIKATNKIEMRKALLENCVPIPKFYKVSSKNEYEIAIKQFNSACIVKPADNSGSRGIYRLDDFEDRDVYFSVYDYCHQFTRNGDLIVEEFMNGPEVSVETLSVDGTCHVIQITDKLTTGAPHFVEMGHSQPSQFDGEMQEKVKKVAIAANKAIGITTGPSHTEIIVSAEGPKIVELGARLGGDCITTHLVPLSTGIDMVECCLKIALGEKPDIARKWDRGSAIRYLEQKLGEVKSINGIKDARASKGVELVSIVHGRGSRVTEIKNSAARMGFVVAQGETAEDAISVAQSALKKITVQIMP
jgi:biotin carboxylase